MQSATRDGREESHLGAIVQRSVLARERLVERHAHGAAARKALGVGAATRDQCVAQRAQRGGLGLQAFAALPSASRIAAK